MVNNKELFVIKRNGRGREPLNIDKIHEMVEFACEDISGVSSSLVEMNSGLQLYDKSLNEKWELMKAANTPLALIHGVNFTIKDINFVLEKKYLELLQNKEINQNELQEYISKYNNVVKEMRIKWVALKD